MAAQQEEPQIAQIRTRQATDYTDWKKRSHRLHKFRKEEPQISQIITDERREVGQCAWKSGGFENAVFNNGGSENEAATNLPPPRIVSLTTAPTLIPSVEICVICGSPFFVPCNLWRSLCDCGSLR
jgi:hypothetical protein